MGKIIKIYPELHIEGLQIELGIQNIGGNLKLYQSLLRTFYQETGGLVEQLKSLWLNDKELFRIKVHGIKGSSSYIAALELFESSSKLEAAAKHLDIAYIDRHMDSYINQIRTQLKHIKAYLDSIPREDQRGRTMGGEVSIVLAQLLKDAIDEMDLEGSWKCIKVIQKRHQSAATKEILIKLNQLLENLDYEEAIYIIEENWLK